MSTYQRPRLTLADHKAVVRSWRGRATHPTHGTVSSEKDECEFQWKRGAPTDRSDNHSGAVYEASIADTDDASRRLDTHEEEEDEDTGALRTVGQIKHTYRTRARREEAESEKKAVRLQIERRKRQPIASHSTQPPPQHQLIMTKTSGPTITLASPLVYDGHSNEATHDNDDQRATADPDDQPMVLEAQSLVSSAQYRGDVLRAVRAELSAGRDVRLQIRGLPAPDVADVKLAVQQICTESLLFCVRDQNVIPTVNVQRSEVTLELLARRSAFRVS